MSPVRRMFYLKGRTLTTVKRRCKQYRSHKRTRST